MRMPSIPDYKNGLQAPPSYVFSDEDLKKGQVKRDSSGKIPEVQTGNFAMVFKVESEKGTWAVRCFHRIWIETREERYEKITEYLRGKKLGCLVGFEYQARGVRINQEWYPIVKMEWVNGKELGEYVKEHIGEPERLARLAKQWVKVCEELQEAGIAHGDLQHRNILVNERDEIKLVDYDGMYIREIAGLASEEGGLEHYQHPTRRGNQASLNASNYLELDNFSAHIIGASLRVLSLDGSLWKDTEYLLFHETHYQDVRAGLLPKLRGHEDERISEIARALGKNVIGAKSYLAVPRISAEEATQIKAMPTLYGLYTNQAPEEAQQLELPQWLHERIGTTVSPTTQPTMFNPPPTNFFSQWFATPSPVQTPPPVDSTEDDYLDLDFDLDFAQKLALARQFTGTHNTDWKPIIVPLGEIIEGAKLPEMEMCLVPVGSFMMGSDDGYGNEKPVRSQTIDKPYWIARYTVTNAQWRVAVEAKAVDVPRRVEWYNDPKMADCPVVYVTWHQALAFAQWAGCTLPSELETEYAARGVESWVYPWGNDWEDGKRAVWDKNSGDKPHPVTIKPEGVSWVGAMHLSGNVWEWQRSAYEAYPYNPDDGREDLINNTNRNRVLHRVLRGGSWGVNDTYLLRSSSRDSYTPVYSDVSIGFRCARS